MTTMGAGLIGEPGPRGPLVAMDTATRRAVVAIGDGVAAPEASRTWFAGYRHGEELLAVLEDVRARAGLSLEELGGVVVGTGPGAFTGLRVGLATAKALAYGLGIPIVGVPSTAALAVAGAADEPRAQSAQGIAVAVLLPAGPHDLYLARYDVSRGSQARRTRAVALADPELVPGRDPIDDRLAGLLAVAVDLDGSPSVSPDAAARGSAAQKGLGDALLALGRGAYDAGQVADVAELVPGYVTLPRGITQQLGAIEWSRDLR